MALILLAVLMVAAVSCQAPANAPNTAATPTAEAEAATPTAAPSATAEPAAPTATAEPATVEPAATAEPAPTRDAPEANRPAFCPEVPRPAVALSVAGESYLVANPFSGETCTATLDGGAPARFEVGGDALYWVAMTGDGYVVRRLGPDGRTTDLAFTARTQQEAAGYYNFAVSADGRQIAWSAGRPAVDNPADSLNEMWVAGTDGSVLVSPLGEQRRSGDRPQGLVPVRFSADGSTLFYAWQPMGVGGSWSAFTGRYDTLYSLRLRTDAPATAVFDCAEVDAFLCLGDFLELDAQASLLAYVDGDGALVIRNGLGDTLNTITPAGANYVSYPTFHANGELVFYAAELSGDSLLPAAATIFRVAPPTAPAEALASSPSLLLPHAWLDETHVMVGYSQNELNWGTAVVGLDGTVDVMQAEPNAGFIAVLDEMAATNPPAVDFGPRATYEDVVASVAVDYPAGWNIIDVEDAVKESSMAYAVSFFSWEAPQAGGEGIPEGETKFDLMVMDTGATSLEEVLAEHKAVMADNRPPEPEQLLSEQRWTLAGGLEAARWMLEGPQATRLVVLAYVDGRVVMISGLGDLGLVDAIARSLRPLPSGE